MEHVLDTGAVDLLEGEVHNRRLGAGLVLNDLGESEDRDLVAGANVEDLSSRLVGVGDEIAERMDRVLDVAEAASLIAVSIDLDLGPGERPFDEAWDNHAVRPCLPGPDCVEEAHDHGLEAELLVICEREELVHRLGIRICPALLRCCAIYPARAFAQWNGGTM